ncbi:hypothetical protein BC777_0112 [Yoonia maricola]|uniref:Uncharacterized protein n=1 Tax=Yoonia maricola TaxID=420999 RepID=A0A2M8WK37_9RHOB|nr:hypothetical protein BC777_0112 [Yoonia maricola]
MGHVHLSRESTLSFLTETVGYKAGLVLNADRLAAMLQDYDEVLAGRITNADVSGFRFHSSEMQSIVAHLLFKVGNIDDPSTKR